MKEIDERIEIRKELWKESMKRKKEQWDRREIIKRRTEKKWMEEKRTKEKKDRK